MRGLLVLTLGALLACSGDPFPVESITEQPEAGLAEVVVLTAVRGRLEPTRWSVSLDLENDGGPGEFYLHLQGVSAQPAGPRTECGLTPERDVPGAWRETVTYVIECPRAPQWVTVFTRSDGETEFRESDVWTY